jgi:hypothetical protein
MRFYAKIKNQNVGHEHVQNRKIQVVRMLNWESVMILSE